MLLPSPSISCYSTRLRYYNLDSTYPKQEGRSGPSRKKAPQKDAVPSGPLFLCAATSSMAIAAGGLSLVETDRLGFLQQENKASWRNVALCWPPCTGGAPPAALGQRWRPCAFGGTQGLAGEAWLRVSGSLQLRTGNPCTTLMKAVAQCGRTGGAQISQTSPVRKFSSSLFLYPLPTLQPRDGCESREVPTALWGLSR